MSFKFKIGDLVYLDDPRRDEFLVAKAFRVVGRTLEECPGGVQPQYLIRGFDLLNETSRVHEFELSAWTEKETKAYRTHVTEDWVRSMSSVGLIEISVKVEQEMRRRSEEDRPSLATWHRDAHALTSIWVSPSRLPGF